MSLCTWATVVSTVPSRSLHGVEPRQIFGETGEPVPLPTFLSFLQLLEELNREETETSAVKETKLFCQESFNSSSLSSSSSSSDIDLDKFLDLDGLNDEDIFEASSMEATNLGTNSHCSTSDWTSPHSPFSSASEYFCGADYFLPSAEILPYEDVCKHQDFSDWSPELFELKNTFRDPGETPSNAAESKSTHEFNGENPSENETACQCRGEAPFQKAEKENMCRFSGETPLNAAGRKESANRKTAATSAHSGKARTRSFTALNWPQEPVKHKRKRKCTNCFERQESRSQCKSFGATWRQVKLR